jgi:hypothetical protein
VTLSGRRLVGAYGRAAPEVPLARLCAAEDGGASESFEVPSLAGAWSLSREEWLHAMGTPLSLLGVIPFLVRRILNFVPLSPPKAK